MSDAKLPTLAYNEDHTPVRLSFLTHVEKNTLPYIVVVLTAWWPIQSY
jgi:hypothetical protein